jgi:hypothetical protein
MKTQMTVLVACLALLAVVVPLQAHHPFSAQYDKNKPVTMMGTVTKVDWSNPHAHIFMDVKDENGKMQNWEFELGGVKKLEDLGWKKDSLKMGDHITVKGWKALDGTNRGNADTITMSNGTTLNAGSSFYDKKAGSKPISN